MTRYRFFHILEILILYIKDPTFLIIENEPALLKTSFLAGWLELIFEPFIYFRSLSVYSIASFYFLSVFFFITSFISFRTLLTSPTTFFIFCTNLSTSRTFPVGFSPSPWMFGIFLGLYRIGTFLYLNVTYYYEQTQL